MTPRRTYCVPGFDKEVENMKKKNILYVLVLIVLIAVLALVTRAHHSLDTLLPAESPQPGSTVLSSPEPTSEPTPEPEETPSPTPAPTPTPTPEPTPYRPDIDISSWEYMLVNAENNIGEYIPELTELEGGQKFDSRAVDALQEFINAARAQGLSVYLSSSYRSYAEQEYLYNRKVAQYGDPAVAATIVAPPGTSEHQTGLCCDITDIYYATKDSSLENTALFIWMKEHCHEYGFIVRYPKEKQDITGIIYEPWHFRYVGVEAATFIMENGLCLEEFVALYND